MMMLALYPFFLAICCSFEASKRCLGRKSSHSPWVMLLLDGVPAMDLHDNGATQQRYVRILKTHDSEHMFCLYITMFLYNFANVISTALYEMASLNVHLAEGRYNGSNL